MDVSSQRHLESSGIPLKESYLDLLSGKSSSSSVSLEPYGVRVLAAS